MSSVFLAERKISNIGPSNLSGVIDIENRLSPLSESKELPRDSRDDTKKQHREKRRQEMEKRKEERKREMERRRLERAKEKSEKEKLSSPKRIVAETAVVSERDSDREKFEPWEDLDEARDSPLSDVTVSAELGTRYARWLAFWEESTPCSQGFSTELNADVSLILEIAHVTRGLAFFIQ